MSEDLYLCIAFGEPTPVDVAQRGAQEVGRKPRLFQDGEVFLDEVFQGIRRVREGGSALRQHGAGFIHEGIVAEPGVGRFDSVPHAELSDTFEQVWHAQIEREEASAQKSPLEQSLGPAQRWPYYALKRARLFRLIQDVVEARRHSDTIGSTRRGRRMEWAETSYTGFGGRLRGRADHVVERAGKIEIEDYKTGTILDASEDDTSEIKPAYRRQMLLYAALEWDAHGTWPDRARLISLTGQHADIVIDTDESLTLAQEVVALLDSYNVLVAEGQSVIDLCTPSQEVCATCAFKAFCPCFWKEVSPAWEMAQRLAFIEGLITGISTTTSGDLTIEIDVRSGNMHRGSCRLRGVSVEQYPDIVALNAGITVRVVGAQVRNPDEPRDLVPNFRTELWWDDSQAGSVV